MRYARGGLPYCSKALALAVLAAFSLTATVADAKPRKKAQVERSAKSSSKYSAKSASKTKPSSNTKTAAAADPDGGRWRYGSAAIIVDANTGKVLYEENSDALRHPASVTKIMTLYLLFEQLEAGNLRLDSKLEVSAKAASQQPSKLGVRPGQTIEVEDAIKAIVTRSANDVAVVIAENLAGSESAFAEAMTEKARALGMSRTVYRNASGLPNVNQVTTARDLSILGRAIQDRFPKQYKYFATRTFYYRGQAIGNHNRLLGRIDGVDGIKTGYTNASGYNLVTSVKRDGRYLVGVVLGGSSGGSRDARMTSLISQNLPTAYAGGRVAPKITEVADNAFSIGKPGSFNAPMPVVAARDDVQPHAVAPLPKPAVVEANAEPTTTASIPAKPATRTANQAVAAAAPSAPLPQVKPGSAEPIKPVAVKTVSIQKPTAANVAAVPAPAPIPVQVAATTQFTSAPAGVLGYLGPSRLAQSPAAAAATAAAEGRAHAKPQQVAARTDVPAPAPAAPTGKDTSRLGVPDAAAEQAMRAARIAAMEPDDPYARALRSAREGVVDDRARPQAAQQAAKPVRTASLAPVAAPQPAVAPAPSQRSHVPASAKNGWSIQIGAFDGERAARTKLDAARARVKSALAGADPYTEKVTKGSTELYRARFAGFDEKSAKEACRLLKRNDFDCMPIRN
ncbi:D-alanyl-D-alanine carboxypeptidase [Xanthobacter sp.]|uniref:D-alanyl-D-alanine carboxypeptidase n=1 Tax=Xanthobacter sp. TaxID=35809 RepID=UPI0025D58110|nr:D-alanyl-D-alanine carboxypeptidase [Xanthobacter sp.]